MCPSNDRKLFFYQKGGLVKSAQELTWNLNFIFTTLIGGVVNMWLTREPVRPWAWMVKQSFSYLVYSLDSVRVFFSTTGFQFVNLPSILYLCKIKCRNISYYCTFIKYYVSVILLFPFNIAKKDFYKCCKVEMF